jgi:spermidine synthase
MGGTFAVIGKHVIQHGQRLGRDTAFLYGVNTAGAVLGAGLSGFFLIKAFGHNGAFFLASLLNILTGLVAMGLEKWRGPYPEKRQTGISPTPPGPVHASSIQISLGLLGLAVSGFCALAYEVFWTRLLILMVDNSVYSFTIILVAFLLGIAIGSLASAPLIKWLKNPLLIFALLEMGIGLSAFFFPFAVHPKPVGASVPYYVFLIQKVFLMVLVPTILMGMTLPLMARIYQSREQGVGRNLGTVYAVNTVGGVLGAAGAGFVLIPLVGFQKSLVLLPALNLAIGGLILMSLLKRVPRIWAGAGFVVLLILGIWLTPHDLVQKRYAQLEPRSRLIFYKEGLAATAAIFQRPDGAKVLYLNGIPEVRTDLNSVRTFRLMGALPTLLHENPQKALIITFGAGITTGTVAISSDRVDCVELVGAAREIAQHFSRENNGIMKRDKIHLHINDARHYLLTTPMRYDLIVADATHPRSYDSWILFTKEFYELVRKRLESDGIFCQWIPLHGMDLKQYMAIVHTFFAAYPHTSIWTIGEEYSLLIGTPETLQIDFTRFVKKMLNKEMRHDLMKVGLENPFRFLSHFTVGEKGVEKMLRRFPSVITDDSSQHLFFKITATPEEMYDKWLSRNYQQLHLHRESILSHFTNMGRTESQRRRVMDMMRAYENRKY